jgi:hypothetical protein
MSVLRVVAFTGPVQVAARTRQLRLDGVERDVGRALTVVFGDCEPGNLPAVLLDVIITTDTALVPGRWQLRAGADHTEIVGRSIHVHRPAADHFYLAVPGAPLTLKARAGWALLLEVLRVPGMTRVLQFLRSR